MAPCRKPAAAPAAAAAAAVPEAVHGKTKKIDNQQPAEMKAEAKAPATPAAGSSSSSRKRPSAAKSALAEPAGCASADKRGPKDLDELLSWADPAMKKIMSDGDMCSRWMGNLMDGLIVSSHFSGMLTPELALEQLVWATQANLTETEKDHVRFNGKLLHAWSCDSNVSCQSLATGWSNDKSVLWDMSGQGHIFGDIFDGLSLEAFRKIRVFENYKKAGHFDEGLDELQAYFMRAGEDAFDTNKCFAHGARCRSVFKEKGFQGTDYASCQLLLIILSRALAGARN